MLFHFNPPLLIWTALLLLAAGVGALLAALIEPVTYSTPLRRAIWRLLRVALGVCVLAALVGIYAAL